MAIDKFTLKLADGSVVTGAIHGSGGIIRGERGAERIRKSIKLADDGRDLGVYEPRPGHVRMYLNYTAAESGGPIDVDLRQASLLAVESNDVVAGPCPFCPKPINCCIHQLSDALGYDLRNEDISE
jgi:hypothetical protein